MRLCVWKEGKDWWWICHSAAIAAAAVVVVAAAITIPWINLSQFFSSSSFTVRDANKWQRIVISNIYHLFVCVCVMPAFIWQFAYVRPILSLVIFSFARYKNCPLFIWKRKIVEMNNIQFQNDSLSIGGRIYQPSFSILWWSKKSIDTRSEQAIVFRYFLFK